MIRNRLWRSGLLAAVLACAGASAGARAEDSLDAFQKKVIRVVEQARPTFVFIGGGSGVMIDPEGWFITNYHVAELLPLTTRVVIGSGKRVTAKRICADPIGDLALFQCEEVKDAPFLKLGDSDALAVGQYVVAMGNPFNLSLGDRSYKTMSPSFSLGIVSALHRQYNAYADAVQTDAPINPGNSGGPLIALDGTLIGINGRIATRFFNRVNSGVGYAIPSNQIARFLPQMRTGGDKGFIHHGRIDGLKLSNRFLEGQGIAISKVKKDSPADRSGFKSGDRIDRINEFSVYNRARFLGLLGTYPAGEVLKVGVIRGSKPEVLSVTLDRVPIPTEEGLPYTGLVLDEVDGELLIMDVKPDSPAEQAGAMPGDQVLSVNGKKMLSAEQFLSQLRGKKGGDRILMVVGRGGQEMTFEIVLVDRPKQE